MTDIIDNPELDNGDIIDTTPDDEIGDGTAQDEPGDEPEP